LTDTNNESYNYINIFLDGESKMEFGVWTRFPSANSLVVFVLSTSRLVTIIRRDDASACVWRRPCLGDTSPACPRALSRAATGRPPPPYARCRGLHRYLRLVFAGVFRWRRAPTTTTYVHPFSSLPAVRNRAPEP